MRVGLVTLVLVVGCSKAGEPSPAPAGKKAGPCREDAEGCQAGCEAGRLEDCHELAWRKIGARGTAIDVAGAEKVLAKACAGKLVQSCGMAAWLVAERGEELAADRRAALDRACRARDGWSCAALASWALRPATPDGRGARDMAGGATWAELGCGADHMWSCGTLEWILRQAAGLPDLDAAGRQRMTALRGMVDQKRSAACKVGKREGCGEGTPEYDAQVRKDCAAGDHGACAEIAHSSQDPAEAMRAARDACERGKLTTTCGLVCNGLRDGVDGAPDLAAARACFDRTCKAGEPLACDALAAGEMLGGGCRAIDMAQLPHVNLTTLPRLTAPDHAGGTFDSAAAGKKDRLYLFTASWNAAGKLSDLAPLAAELAPAGVELVAVLSDDDWSRVRSQIQPADSLVVVLDTPASGENIGRYTTALGITKVPEALVVDASGAVRRHVVGPGILTSRLNSRRCVEEVLKRPK
jgi:hypothetical protein